MTIIMSHQQYEIIIIMKSNNPFFLEIHINKIRNEGRKRYILYLSKKYYSLARVSFTKIYDTANVLFIEVHDKKCLICKIIYK